MLLINLADDYLFSIALLIQGANFRLPGFVKNLADIKSLGIFILSFDPLLKFRLKPQTLPMKHPIKILILALVIIIRPAPETSGQPGRRGFVSPEVQKERTATFRFLAPNAKEVKLSSEFLTTPQSMTRDSVGLWTIKTNPVKPDIYLYFFIVDGIQVQDPNIVLYFSEITTLLFK